MTPPELIVQALIENDEPKDFLARHKDIGDAFEQVGGDRNWFEYGGTFHNPLQGRMLHVSGLDYMGIADKSPWDFPLSDEEKASINAEYPELIDPEYPEGGDQNEPAREEAVSSLQDKKYEEWKTNRKVYVYEWEDGNIEDFSDKFDDISRSFGVDITELPLPNMWEAVGQYLGWDELDLSPALLTEKEITEKLFGKAG